MSNEAAMTIFQAIVTATTPDWTGHLPNCGYTDEHPDCECAAWGGRLLEVLRSTLPDIIAEAQSEAIREAAVDLAENAGEAWGGRSSWLTTGSHVASLAAGWVAEYADERLESDS